MIRKHSVPPLKVSIEGGIQFREIIGRDRKFRHHLGELIMGLLRKGPQRETCGQPVTDQENDRQEL